MDIEAIKAQLLARIGEPYDERHRCLDFLGYAMSLCGITVTEEILRQARDFRAVKVPQFADIAIFQNLPPLGSYHGAFMLDRRWAIQTSMSTNGVARIEISREPWGDILRGVYRHRSLCS